MKKLLMMAVLLPAFAYAEPAPGTKRTFIYEVTFPGSAEPKYVRVPVGKTETLTVPGHTTEYTQMVATVPSHRWQDWVKFGTLPKHDRVSCKANTCTYSELGHVQDEKSLTVAVIEVEGFPQTRVSYVNKLYQVETIRTSTQESGVPVPTGNMQNTVAAKVLTVGESIDLDPKGVAPGSVKLLKVE